MSNPNYEHITKLFEAVCILQSVIADIPTNEINPTLQLSIKQKMDKAEAIKSAAFEYMRCPEQFNKTKDGVLLEITSLRHIFTLGEYLAAKQTEDMLNEAKDKYLVTGVGLAAELVKAEFAELKLTAMQRNITTAVAGGLDVTAGALGVLVNEEGFFLKLIKEGDNEHDEQ